MPTSGVQFRSLGSVAVAGDDRASPVAGRQARLLLAALMVDAGRVVSTDRLAAALWGDTPPPNAHERVAKLVYQLRTEVPDDARAAIETVPPGYRLDPALGYDAAEFERALASARADRRAGECSRALSSFDDALGRWRGPAFGEFAAEPFAHVEAARLEELKVVAEEERAATMLDLGHVDDAVVALESLTASQPYREHVWALFMTALYRSGRQTDALRAYGRVRAALVEELGIEPGPELRAVEHAILEHDPALDATDVPPPAPVRPRESPRPRRMVRYAVAAAIVVVLVGGGALMVTDSEPASTEGATVSPRMNRITVPYEGTLTESIEGNSGGSTFSGSVTGGFISHGTYTGLSKTDAIPPLCSTGTPGVPTSTSTVFTSRRGDTLRQDETGMLCMSGPQSFEFAGTFTFVGGSGCFLGATGTGRVTAKIVYTDGFTKGTSTSENVGSITVPNRAHCPQTR